MAHIKSFEEYAENNVGSISDIDQKLAKEYYNAGVLEAKKYYEEDRISIHEYYTAKVKDLVKKDDEKIAALEKRIKELEK